MNTIPLKYTGKRKRLCQDILHERYVFAAENNYISEVPQNLVRSLVRTGQFMPVEREVEAKAFKTEKEAEKESEKIKVKAKAQKERRLCPNCGRICGSKIGLVSHMRTHN